MSFPGVQAPADSEGPNGEPSVSTSVEPGVTAAVAAEPASKVTPQQTAGERAFAGLPVCYMLLEACVNALSEDASPQDEDEEDGSDQEDEVCR